MPTQSFTDYLNPAGAPGPLTGANRVVVQQAGIMRTFTLGDIAAFLAPLMPQPDPILTVDTQAKLDAAVTANPNRIIVLAVNGVAEKVWLHGSLLTPAVESPTDPTPTVEAPTLTTAPTISPASGGIGSTFTITAGTYYAKGAPITQTGQLLLGATDVTSAIANGRYVSTAAGVLTWKETASTTGGSAPEQTATATVEDVTYPVATTRTINGISWVFTQAGTGAAGTMEDNKTIALIGNGTGNSATATGTFPTVVGQTYTVGFDLDTTQISVFIGPSPSGTAYFNWAGLNTGHYDRTFTATSTSTRIMMTRTNAGPGFARNVIVPTLSIPGMVPTRLTVPAISPWAGNIGTTFTVTPGTYYGELPYQRNGRLMRDNVNVTSQMTGNSYVADTLTSNLRWIEEPTNAAGAGETFTTAVAQVVDGTGNLLPTGYRHFDAANGGFVVDKALAYPWSNTGVNIYLPNWFNGVMSTCDPSLITWNADGSALLKAEQRADGWYMGAMQLKRPLRVFGRVGAVVTVHENTCVHAFFGYDSNGLEVDFENTLRNGVSGWTPAFHLPKTGGGRASSNKRTLNRAPVVVGQPTVLEYDRQPDRVDFYCNGQKFETVTPADMADGYIWDTTTDMDLFVSVEKHGSWAGWTNYTKASMTVHGILA